MTNRLQCHSLSIPVPLLLNKIGGYSDKNVEKFGDSDTFGQIFESFSINTEGNCLRSRLRFHDKGVR